MFRVFSARAQTAMQAPATGPGPAPAPAPVVHADFAAKAHREAFFQNFLKNYIQRDLTQPLTDSTEDDWSDPFWGLELLQYKTPYIQDRISRVWDHIDERSPDFQEAFGELIYTNYPKIYRAQVAQWLVRTPHERIFALLSEYLLADPTDSSARVLIRRSLTSRLDTSQDITLELLRKRLNHEGMPTITPPLDQLFSVNFLPGQTVVFSLQRSNRDYPGLVIIRRPDGTFVKNPDSSYFAAPELGRSITNLPYYLHNGNTPQGIYVMAGFGVSQSRFLGPTLNIQMRMPFETDPGSFLKLDELTDTTWRIDQYRSLLPQAWSQDFNLYGSFYAGIVGRRAIIAHGTTIDPSYYKGRIWYPQTPSLGCLCAYESWDENGMRVSSDQQKIVDALKSTGGAQGYVVVLELDDKAAPVTLSDVSLLMHTTETAPRTAVRKTTHSPTRRIARR